jgi:putative transposase
MPSDLAEAIALARYRIVAEATDERLTPAERGLLVRGLAARLHELPDGSRREYSRATIDRWIRAWRADGLDGLRPQARSDIGLARLAPELIEEACALRREVPARSAEQLSRILHARHGVRVPARTIREHLRRRGLDRARLTAEPRVFGRFEAERPNERWIGDVLVGPFVPHPRVAGSRRAYLFLLVDDHSRLLVHGRWMTEENTRAGQTVLRGAILRRGLPDAIHLDNGAPFANAALERTCAVLGIRLIHSRPYAPQGRGKQERLNRFIREAFLAEALHAGIETFEALNDRFTAWAERVANTRVHAETDTTPIERFTAGGPHRYADPDLLRDAFRWSVTRVVTRTATVSLTGNRYTVEPALVGRRVELRFDPEDLSRVEVWHERRSFGPAVPFVVGRHVHRAVPQAAPPRPEPTGVDYLGLVEEAHDEATLGRLAYRDLSRVDEEERS